MKGYDPQVVAMFLKSKSEVDMEHRFRLYRSTKGIRPGNISFDDSAYLRIRIAENLRRIDQKTFYQIPKQITPGLDIGKGCPEICPVGKFFVSCGRLFEMRYLNAID